MTRVKRLYKHFLVSTLVKVTVFASINGAGIYAQDKPQPQTVSVSGLESERAQSMTAAIRHELAMLPYYGVFDWLGAEIQPDGNVVLRGNVVRPTTKSDAEHRVHRIEVSVSSAPC